MIKKQYLRNVLHVNTPCIIIITIINIFNLAHIYELSVI